MRKEDALRALGIDASATAEQVRRAYRKRVLECHPDQGGSAASLRRVVEAYETLKHAPGRRRRAEALEHGGATFDGKLWSNYWGVVERAESQGAGLYNVFLKTGGRVRAWKLSINDSTNARVSASMDYQTDRMVRISVRMVTESAVHCDSRFVLELGIA